MISEIFNQLRFLKVIHPRKNNALQTTLHDQIAYEILVLIIFFLK